MTDEQREEQLTTLHELGKSIESNGDERDTATAACLYGLCLAISEGAEVDLARHILLLDDQCVDKFADALSGVRGH